jgi:hypothetical protein
MTSPHTPVGAELDDRLAALPPEEPPSRDLWPAILAAIEAGEERRASRWQPRAAVAAGLVLALAAAGYAGWLGGRQSGPPIAPSATAGSAAAALRQASFAVPAGRDYLETRADRERTYRERLELLAPATRERVERDLAVVRAANEDIRRALAADPTSAVLNRLLESTWQQEFDLYATVARSTDSATERTRT